MGSPPTSTSCSSTVTFILLGRPSRHPSFTARRPLLVKRSGCAPRGDRPRAVRRNPRKPAGPRLFQLHVTERPAGHDRRDPHPGLRGGSCLVCWSSVKYGFTFSLCVFSLG